MNTSVLHFRNIQLITLELTHIVVRHWLGGITIPKQTKEDAIELLNKGKINKSIKEHKMGMWFSQSSFNSNNHKPLKYGLRGMRKMW